MKPEDKIKELERKIADLEAKVRLLDKQQIKIVGDYDGTNVPVTVNGIRRKIATVAP